MGTTIDQIKDAISSSTTGVANNWLPLLITYILGQQESAQQKKEGVTPQAAMAGLTGTRNQYQNMFDQSQKGVTQNPMLQQARGTMQTRVNTPVQSPGVFNPYQNASGQPTGYGQPNQELMSKLMASVGGGNQNPIVTQGNNQLMNQLGNRFGSRAMRTGDVSGGLTPSPFLNPQKPAITPQTPTPAWTPPNAATPARTPAQNQEFKNFTSQAARAKPTSEWTFQEWTQYAADGTVPMKQG